MAVVLAETQLGNGQVAAVELLEVLTQGQPVGPDAALARRCKELAPSYKSLSSHATKDWRNDCNGLEQSQH